jgi:DNA polymerase-3 subunit delta'
MHIKDYLIQYQSPLYLTFSRALSQKQLTHAYLINGEPGTPLKEVARYLAASLICENPSPLACGHCLACQRIEDGSYVDFFLFDGDEGSIKKESILDLETAFSRTSVEKEGKLIYVIHKVEKMTPEAINSLLKFLEEPNPDVFAILTTENEARVLPTILSRVQNLPLRLIPRERLIEASVNLGARLDDTELLSLAYNLPETILKLQDDKAYLNVKDSALFVLTHCGLSLEDGVYTSMKVANANINSRDDAKLYLQILLAFFQDIVNYNLQGRLLLPSFDDTTAKLSRVIKNPLSGIKVIIEAMTRIESNVNLNLLLDHVMIHIVKETSYGK